MNTIDTIRYGNGPAKVTYGRRFVLAGTSLVRLVAFLIDRRRSRLALLELSDEQLKDIGISRCDAYVEGNRSFLDPLTVTEELSRRNR